MKSFQGSTEESSEQLKLTPGFRQADVFNFPRAEIQGDEQIRRRPIARERPCAQFGGRNGTDVAGLVNPNALDSVRFIVIRKESDDMIAKNLLPQRFVALANFVSINA